MNIIDVSNSESRVVGEVPGGSVNIELAWSPDSKRIAFNDVDGKVIKIMNLADGSIEDISTRLDDVYIYDVKYTMVLGLLDDYFLYPCRYDEHLESFLHYI